MEATIAASRLVAPGTVRLPLSCGDFLMVKQRLNAGETLKLYARASPPTEFAPLEPMQVGLAIVTAYLLDWSFVDFEGAVIPVRGLTADEQAAALCLLDYDTLLEVVNACSAHHAATRQEKKRQAIEPGS